MDTYFDFKHNLEYANKEINDKVELYWIYFQQLARNEATLENDQNQLKIKIEKIENDIKDYIEFEKWRSNQNIFKRVWMAISNKNEYKEFKKTIKND